MFGVIMPGDPSRVAWFVFCHWLWQKLAGRGCSGATIPPPNDSSRLRPLLERVLVFAPPPRRVLRALAVLLAAGAAATAGSPAGLATVAEPAAGAVAEAESEEVELPGLESLLWNASVTLRTWTGYSDNPTLSALNPTGSALVAGGGDLLLFRTPVDGREATFYAMVEHVGYLTEGVEPETLAVLDGRFKKSWDGGWSAGGSLEYVFLKQVYDASELEGVPTVVRAHGHTVSMRPAVGWTLAPRWRGEVEVEGSRQWLDEPLDSYWDTGPRLTLTHDGPGGAELGGFYRYRSRLFDERSPTTAQGVPVSGTLVYHQHELELFWKRAWGTGGRWRTALRGGALRSLDNGGGFYDYDRLQAAATVRFAAPRWEGRADVRWRNYGYPVQVASGSDDRRRRADLNLSVRGEWKVTRFFHVFAEYQYEVSDENSVAADYRVNAVTGGVILEQ